MADYFIRPRFDATQKAIVLDVVDASGALVTAWGAVTLQLGKAPVTPGAQPGHALGQPVELREVRHRNDAGQIKYCVMLKSPDTDTAKTTDPDEFGGGGGVVAMKIKSVSTAYLTCRSWDGTTEGGTDVLVAKPPALRAAPSRDAAVLLDPPYEAGDVIYAAAADYSGVSGCDLVDLNVDARQWLVLTEGCDETGATKVAYFRRTDWEDPE